MKKDRIDQMAALGSLEIALHIFNSSLGLPCWNDSFVNIRQIVKYKRIDSIKQSASLDLKCLFSHIDNMDINKATKEVRK